ncbi:hypothetical protein [Pseudoxanthomonas sp. Root630]|uniref:hypothetical protein n=1 Tax=Pseudoxanthomonas sp. Root630 TaxID=1736574 RepID=UPI0012DC12D9|nr:hypothetical protein [Pseudoxanthomonas sp. Root630]
MVKWTAGFLFGFSLSCAPVAAHACSYPDPPTFRSALKRATVVFVFRLDETRYREETVGASARKVWSEGTITPVQSLFGDASGYRNLTFKSTSCGGLHLVVGHHYLIATNAKGDTIPLAAADGSLLDLDGFYDPENLKNNLRGPEILPVIQAIYGIKPLPQAYPPSWIADRTGGEPPPPPPPPVR